MNKSTEIPQEMRELAVKSIDQARAACDQLMESAHKATEIIKQIIPPTPVAAGLTDVQEKALRFTKQNLDATFSLANELAKAKDLQEAMQIQNRFMQLQIHSYALQAQELGTLVTNAAQKVTERS
jgi:phasin